MLHPLFRLILLNRRLAVCVSVLLLSIVVACTAAQARPLFGSPHSLEESGKDLADDLAETGLLKDKRIAVLEFEPRGTAAPSMLGKRIAEYLALALVGVKGRTWTVVERLELARMQNEMNEHKDSTVSYNDWMRKNLRADVLVLGSYVLSDKKLLITAKVVDPLNGSTVASAAVSQYIDEEARQLARTRKPVTDFARVAEDITAMLTGREVPGRDKEQSRVKLFKLVGGNRINFRQGQLPVYKVGTKMGFSVRPPMDSKLYILNYDPAAEHGEAILLYPIPLMQAYEFPRERTRIFPACISQGVTSYDVEEPKGRMVFKIIGVDSSVKMDLTRSLMEKDGYFWLDSGNISEFISDLASLPDTSWWSEDVEFWIE